LAKANSPTLNFLHLGDSVIAATIQIKESATGTLPLKPPLKWAGGKRWLASHVVALWDSSTSRRYVEPFCGGLAVALTLQPKVAILNDINPHLINFYRQVQKGLSVNIEMENDESLFYEHRDRFNELARGNKLGTPEAAQLFYYLNRTCFNGLCRFNQSGEFNVPFGTYSSINYVSDFHGYRQVFKQWRFSNLDISEVELERDDFVYADPPYDVEFTAYSAGGFSWDDQVRTAELLAKHPGPVVISNQATKRIVSLYRTLKYRVRFLNAPRRISCTGDRSTAREVLATRNV
jgi:DNA adenine methylase